MPSSSQERALKGLRIAVVSWAVMGLVGIPLLVQFDVACGWRWEPDNPIYDQMTVSIYVALGLVMARAIRDPLKHWSLLEFTVVSSVFHGGVMFWHAMADPMHRRELASIQKGIGLNSYFPLISTCPALPRRKR